uniref:Zinc finger, CCHC-type n=1 Tax=Tanacetum cinerariifolium TaxID=118510 RepID=A0A699GZE9_TANCI|nr:zinc finger, CCHC-type [Tanacetum cinerariifolium]
MAKEDAFLLTTLKVVYVLTTPMLELMKDDTVKAIRKRAKWENDDYICKGHILNEDVSSKNFLVSNFNNYKMVDSRLVMEQYNELLRILRQYTQRRLKTDESILVSSIIDKLPPSWKDFNHTLKHGKYDLSLVQLGSHLRIEDSLRAQDSDKGKGKNVDGPSVNMTEEGKNKNNKQNKGKKRSFEENNSGSGSNKKPKLECWKCGKTGHFKRDCRSAFYVQVDSIAWWIDFGATTHVCKDCCWFKTYEPIKDGSVLYMGDDHFAPVHEKGSVVLELSLGKSITLFNVLYVPKLQAINDGIGSIIENNTWVLSDLPLRCKPLGCKWIFKRKMKVDGTIDKFKARLVIQGYRQKEGIDYFDTYEPVACITTIRFLFALATIHNLVIHQMDVKTAFLNGDLDEEVYMKQPKRLVMPLMSISKFDSSGKGVIICIHVDDMLIFETDQNQVDKTKKFLSSRFSMKDIGEANVILGIKIKRKNKEIVITQSHYIQKILKKFNREDCSPASNKKTCITGSTMESEFVALAAASKEAG